MRIQYERILKIGGVLYPSCIHQQKPQLVVALIKQSQLLVTQKELKLTQMSQPPNTKRIEGNREKVKVFQHHRQILSQDRNLTIQKRRKTSETPTNCFWIVTKEEENKWVLSDEMAAYASRIFEEYIPDGDIEEKL